MNVIPSINCASAEGAREKIEILKEFLPENEFVHLDVTDGVFSAHPTWNDPRGWAHLKAPFQLEVHLMVEFPLDLAEDWFAAGARRLVVHSETLTNEVMHHLFQTANRYRGELMLSSKPEATNDDLEPFLTRFAAFQVLSVNPGAAGQEFLPFSLDKIRFLREAVPDATIEVDGGINRETAQLVKKAGADTLVSAKYIFDDKHPEAAYQTLRGI
ncbi:MAG TPA: hypothetical protein VMU07_00870 [Candidatus Paceibacterota bacterium]|nr:hypothetical protein [Candidatus Paceibacterota bacterium]